MLKELERSGTVSIILALTRLKEGKFTDIYYESIRMGFRVGGGVISRRLDQLCGLGWVQKMRNEKGSRVFTLTEMGLRLAKAVKEFIRSLERDKIE